MPKPLDDHRLNLDDFLTPEKSAEQGAEPERLGWPSEEEAKRYVGRPIHALHPISSEEKLGNIPMTIDRDHEGLVTRIEEITPGSFVLVAEFQIDDQEGRVRWRAGHRIYRSDLGDSFAIGERRPSPPPPERASRVPRPPESEPETQLENQEWSGLVARIQELGAQASATPEEVDGIERDAQQLLDGLTERFGGKLQRKTVTDPRDGIQTVNEFMLGEPLPHDIAAALTRTFAALVGARDRELKRTRKNPTEITGRISALSQKVFALLTARPGR